MLGVICIVLDVTAKIKCVQIKVQSASSAQHLIFEIIINRGRSAFNNTWNHGKERLNDIRSCSINMYDVNKEVRCFMSPPSCELQGATWSVM